VFARSVFLTDYSAVQALIPLLELRRLNLMEASEPFAQPSSSTPVTPVRPTGSRHLTLTIAPLRRMPSSQSQQHHSQALAPASSMPLPRVPETPPRNRQQQQQPNSHRSRARKSKRPERIDHQTVEVFIRGHRHSSTGSQVIVHPIESGPSPLVSPSKRKRTETTVFNPRVLSFQSFSNRTSLPRMLL
jgi:hypothetical protein